MPCLYLFADYPQSCRQVIDSKQLTLRDKPCLGATPVAGVPDLKQYDTFTYLGAFGKKSSECFGVTGAKAYDGLCWVKAVWQGQTGWLPAGRLLGKVTSAFCTSDQGTGTALVRELCGACGLCMSGVWCYCFCTLPCTLPLR
jgi:hypothetical protein